MKYPCEKAEFSSKSNIGLDQSIRNLALSGFELEILKRFDFFHDEHDVVYVYFDSKDDNDVMPLRGVAFAHILMYLALSEGLAIQDDEIHELVINVEEHIQKHGDLIESDEIIEMLGEVA